MAAILAASSSASSALPLPPLNNRRMAPRHVWCARVAVKSPNSRRIAAIRTHETAGRAAHDTTDHHQPRPPRPTRGGPASVPDPATNQIRPIVISTTPSRLAGRHSVNLATNFGEDVLEVLDRGAPSSQPAEKPQTVWRAGFSVRWRALAGECDRSTRGNGERTDEKPQTVQRPCLPRFMSGCACRQGLARVDPVISHATGNGPTKSPNHRQTALPTGLPVARPLTGAGARADGHCRERAADLDPVSALPCREAAPRSRL
jgi:hypothetical protein